MRVLLVISDYKNGFPYIQDLESELKAKGVFVNTLDIQNLLLIDQQGETKRLASFGFFLKLPRIRTWLRLLVVKRFLRSVKGKFDTVGIHSCDPIYDFLVEELDHVSPNLTVTVWGSDFYRAPDSLRNRKQKLLDRCKAIVFGNPSNKEDFINYYNKYHDRSIVCGFGITKFDIINSVLSRLTVNEIKSELQLPLDKFIVTIGYNGSPGQQHIKLIDSIMDLSQEEKSAIFLIFQMTYGGSADYKRSVERKAKESGINFRVIDHFLDDEETSKIRIATDIVLNAQITDGFSASIQEHIYANNKVVVGNWLKYQSLDDSGIYYLRSDFAGFAGHLRNICRDFGKYDALTRDNANKIYQLSSWNSRLPVWIKIYDPEGQNSKYGSVVADGADHEKIKFNTIAHNG
jgi:serine/threonine protein kinase